MRPRAAEVRRAWWLSVRTLQAVLVLRPCPWQYPTTRCSEGRARGAPRPALAGVRGVGVRGRGERGGNERLRSPPPHQRGHCAATPRPLRHCRQRGRWGNERGFTCVVHSRAIGPARAAQGTALVRGEAANDGPHVFTNHARQAPCNAVPVLAVLMTLRTQCRVSAVASAARRRDNTAEQRKPRDYSARRS